MNVNEVLERFRMAEYHYPDVIWHDLRSAKLKPKLTTELVNLTPDEFKKLLLSKLFLPKSVSKQLAETIVVANDFNEVKLKLFDLFLGIRPLKERLQTVMDLQGFDPCLVSQLMASVNNDEYTIYHQNVVNGIEDFLAHVVDWEIIDLNVKTAENYLDFNELCKSIKNNFGFRSLGELHEFFWHGHSSGWNFII
ncbi:MAG: hypothetical protein QCH99_06425 [Candidatus Bathyarchaeota archaeon]|nr:hypothetical protein [Candidatus Bathyarchaeum tardum]WGM89821.1 MAG: hypothetical protein NUK63_01470 [Candidatus Bathyarchaeum tardum]